MMFITSGGTLVRTRVAEVSVMGRNTQGVRLIRLGEDENLNGIECIANIQAVDVAGAEQETDTDASSNSETDSDKPEAEKE